jgi:phosphate transport system substrate-binding protein
MLGGSARAWAERVTLAAAGSSLAAPLYEHWADAFHAKHPEVAIVYNRAGSGEGIARFVARSVDIGASDIPPGDENSEGVKDGTVMIPATAGLVVLAYHLPRVHGELRLPPDVYAGIFAGVIKTWDDPAIRQANPELSLPHRTIAVVAREDSSGTTQAFTAHLNAASRVWAERKLEVGPIVAWPAATMQVSGNGGVAARIRISEWSIGYVEYGFARQLGLTMAVLQNAAKQYVRPNGQSGTAALEAGTAQNAGDPRIAIHNPPGQDSYPIVTYSWLLLRQQYAEVEKSRAIQAFVRFGLGEGQAMAEVLGYVPLPPAVADQAFAAIETIH